MGSYFVTRLIAFQYPLTSCPMPIELAQKGLYKATPANLKERLQNVEKALQSVEDSLQISQASLEWRLNAVIAFNAAIALGLLFRKPIW